MKPTFYADTLRLRWAYEGEEEELHRGIDIPKGVTLHFDVYSSKLESGTELTDEHVRIIQVANRAARYSPQFMTGLDLGKRYRFIILVAAEGIDPVEFSIDVDMGNAWDQLRVLDPGAGAIRPRTRRSIFRWL